MEVITKTVTEPAPERDEPRPEREQPRPAPVAGGEEGLRFADPYWDEAFCAWWDPTLRTCC